MRTFLLPLLLFAFAWTACDSAADRGTDYTLEEKWEPTRGIITEMQEVDSNEFRIIDERVVERKEDSRIITHYLNGSTDTLTLDQAQRTANQPTEPATQNDRRHSGGYGFYGVLRGGLMGYYLGRSFSVPPSAGVYMDQNTYNRVSSNAGQTLQQTARRTTVRRPTRSTSGYGSRRSTRSYGG